MKIVIESPEKLTDSDLEEIVDVWNRKGRRIAETLIQTLVSLHMHTSLLMDFVKYLLIIQFPRG